MAVTPFIDENEVVTLNVRPTISRIIGFVTDPNPALADAGVTSEIPVIQVREIESVLKIENGDTAVIGGLMQDQIDKSTTGIPILSSIPVLGALFRYQDDKYVKSELVIFIRPVVTQDASLTGDLKEYRKYLLEDLHADNKSQLDTAQMSESDSSEDKQ
jgi:general secretion pathway protein D